MRLEDAVQWKVFSGERVSAGGAVVIPQSQALVVRLPFGGFVWNRPAAILVERDGRTDRYPIIDATRLMEIAAAGMMLVLWLVLLALWGRQREGTHGHE